MCLYLRMNRLSLTRTCDHESLILKWHMKVVRDGDILSPVKSKSGMLHNKTPYGGRSGAASGGIEECLTVGRLSKDSCRCGF